MPRLIDLLTAAADHDDTGPVNADRYRERILFGHQSQDRSVTVWETPDGAIAAFAEIWRDAPAAGAVDALVEVHPAHRAPGVVDATMGQIREDALALLDGPGAIRVHGRDRQMWKAALLARYGFAVDRRFHRMARDLILPIPEPVAPAGYATRPLAGDAEVPPWCQVATDAFAGHYDAPRFTVDERLARMASATYVPSLDLVAVDEADQIVGVAWSLRERMTDGAERGNVNFVAVLPAHRGRGIARALLSASLIGLRDLGVPTAGLVVDAGNETNALRLYESAGFVPVDQAVVYLARIESFRPRLMPTRPSGASS